MEFLECLPTGFQPRVRVEELVELCLVCVGERVASACQQEPGAKHLRTCDGFGSVVSALDVATHRCYPGGEPSDDTEPVKHMACLTGKQASMEALYALDPSLTTTLTLRCQRWVATSTTLSTQRLSGVRPSLECGRYRR